MGVEGTTLAGRYRLERLLAEGGMGQVWVARHLTLDIPVAVKLMSGAATLRSELRSRFELEAKAIAQLRSPNIVQIFDYGTEQETPYIVMELLEGSDLLALIPSRPRWPLSEIADLVTQVGKGLAAAHARGIVHRDIKPGNIFLSRAGTDTVIKLLDFGIAKWIASEQNLTETDAVLGSPYYMAPEQVRGEKLDHRADLWALSVVAYRLATGSLPFEGRDAIEVAERVMIGAWRPVPASAPKAGQLQRFFARAFTQQPEGRFASAGELTEAFLAITGPSTPAWTGERAAVKGENTVTLLRPRASQPDTPIEVGSITEVSQSNLVFTDPEGETSTVALPTKLLEQTTQKVPTVPVEELKEHLARLPEEPDRTARQLATPPQPLQQHLTTRDGQPNDAHQQARPHAGALWGEDSADMLATVRMGHHQPEVQASLVVADWPTSHARPSATVISLSLCGALVLVIGIWIAVNVGSGQTSDARDASASAAGAERGTPKGIVAPPNDVPPMSPSTSALPTASATAMPSSSPMSAPLSPPTSRSPRGGSKPKGGSPPAWLHHK